MPISELNRVPSGWGDDDDDDDGRITIVS